MKTKLTIFIIFTMLAPCLANAKSVLTRMNKINGKDSVELYCKFSKIPSYRSNIRGKRVDFILDDTTINPGFSFFEADDKIVKILSLHKNNKTILSFFFRFPPQRFDIIPDKEANKLTINILLGNPYSAALPEFSAKLDGLTIIERTTKDFSNPLVASKYAADWKSFFKLYESKIKLTLPVQFTQLPFPAIAYLLPDREKNKEILDKEIYTLAEQGLWNDILPLLLKQIEKAVDPEIKKKLALTYGDVLSRDNNFSDAYKQLYLLADEYSEEELGVFAKYLLILLRARFEDPFIADFEFRNLQDSMTQGNPLTPYFLISQIETALATEQYSRMHDLLGRDDIAYPEETATIRELRQADYWYGTGDLIKAYVGYQLFDKHDVLLDKTFSLNGYCDTLYQQKQFPEASHCYNLLAGHVNEKEELGLINYRKHLAELKYKPPVEMIDYFAGIEHTYPGTEAGFKGAIKKTDLRYLTLKDWSETAIKYYHALGEKSVTRSTREEASFKEALLYRLSGQNIKSMQLVMIFLRNFRKGELFKSGQALLIELFPKVIKEYVEKKMYMEALVLAKQNRKLFIKNWVSINLLSELAHSYNALGIYNEASKLYLYLLTLSSEDQKEQYYLPLISSAYDHGSYDFVEDYADQYNFKYPKGEYRTKILILRIRSLLAEERYQDAISILPEIIPDTETFSLLAATLYFHENKYEKVVEILDRPIEISKKELSATHFILGESLYQLQEYDRAKEEFLAVTKGSIHYDQSRYRLGELSKMEGDKKASLKFYKELVETDNASLWTKLAKKELALAEFFQ